ncbi:MAG TPA: LysE family translocator [Noviherbaspirillum sp.]|jgi:threonine/homoserine/homoserine lactone efflux protein|uniref:LysE family translocator n=1 Tax=Noviherbaspirillum sp. TaxID=1926288 RepID=UPI002DDD2B0B|nr:LysE family translocator [Noviherbaspirillum sp.]HEV2609328.1 LysE family translocator [Noviherbaspirillum sp.]
MNFLGISDFGLFCAAVLLLNATPGPDTAYIVGRSIAQGRAAGIMSALGISVGCCVHALASALGLSAILAASSAAFLVIKLAGGAYLIYLGIRMLMVKPAADTGADGASAAALRDNRAPATIFWQAMITNVLNPKVILFFLAFIPQFVQGDSSQKTIAFLVLGLAFAAISMCWNSGTALLAGTLARRAGRSPHVRLWLERGVGAAFVALGAKLMLTKN